MNNNFKPENFFELSLDEGVIFFKKDYVWEILSFLGEYIIEEFKKGKASANYKNSRNIFIGEGTVIEEGAFIKGPAIIGNNSFIGHGSYLRPNCIIGNNVSIGHASEIKNSVIFSNSAVGHLNYIGDSILGHNVNIGGGAKTANFRLDGKTISVKHNGERIDTQLTKFGAILGDNTKIGVNAVLNPGTVLGKNVHVYPLTLVFGTHPDNSIIK